MNSPPPRVPDRLPSKPTRLITLLHTCSVIILTVLISPACRGANKVEGGVRTPIVLTQVPAKNRAVDRDASYPATRLQFSTELGWRF